MATYTPSRPSTHTSLPLTSTDCPSHLHRSPKRARGTPSPEILQSSTSSSSSSSSSHRVRRPLVNRTSSDTRKSLSSDKRGASASWQGGLGYHHYMAETSSSHRRREMSVPLLSESLSTFSISHTSPLEAPSSSICHTPVSVPFHIPSPPPYGHPHPSMTPRRVPMFPLHTPHPAPLPRDHSYPATAPLPQISSFLGSPFSTRTTREAYAYKAVSPSRAAATESLRQGKFSPDFSWMDRSEWMVEEELGPDGLPFSSPTRLNFEPYSGFSPEGEESSGLVRDASGSTTSNGDWSGSTTSSTSLTSLGRGSSEFHQSSVVTIRGEFGNYDPDGYEEVDTPSRQLFVPSEAAAEDPLTMSGKPNGFSPNTSPLVGRSGGSKSSKMAIEKEVSPLQAFLMARTPSDSSHRSMVDPSSRQSPISFIPRLMSTTKSAFKREPSSPLCKSSSARTLSFASVKKVTLSQHVETAKSAAKVSARRSDKLSPTVLSSAVKTSRGRPPLFMQSPSSDSSDDISPSKPPITATSTPSTLTASTDSQSPLGPARSAVITRRKTIIGSNAKKSAPAVTALRKPMRPNMRRGVTEPNPHLLSPSYAGMMTPPTLFADVRPSPAAFASTGLVKKKSNTPGLEIPRFGESEPRRPKPVISPVKPVKSRLANMTTGTDISSSNHSGASVGTSDASVSVYVRNAQKMRGLRRKTSTMFASGSNGSIIDPKSPGASSPLTPTKPNGLKVVPLGLGLSTPSPTTPTSFDYPFAPSSSISTIASSPLTRFDHPPSDITETSPSYEKVMRGSRPHLLRTRPIARASNPMLAASYKAQDPRSRPHFSAPGNRINSDFVILEILGQGEFSQVWKVKEKKTSGLYAVKAGRPYTGKKNRLRQLEEVAILHQLSALPHPNIVSFIDSWEHNNRLYIRNTLAPCGDLSTYLFSVAERGGMGEPRVWKTLYELSNGLGHIHKNNFIHLDLKPSNILITAEGSLQIADFGMSTILTLNGIIGAVSPALPDAVDGEFVWREGQDGSVPVPSPIIDREVEGDREYLSPEALQKETIGRPADVYSLGILLLEAALNVVLPPNGEGWVKLRQDDFSDLAEHYVPRVKGQTALTSGTEEVLPILSEELLRVIKRLMDANSAQRMTLEDLARLAPIRVLEKIKESSEDSHKLRAALVEEDAAFLDMLLQD